MAIFFCKDILSPQMGLAIFQAIAECLPKVQWRFYTDDGWSETHDLDEYLAEKPEEIPEERQVELEEFIRLRWRHREDDVQVVGAVDKSGAFELEAWCPRKGGFAIRKGMPIGWEGRFELIARDLEWTEDLANSFKQCLERLFPVLEASYGFIAPRRFLPLGWGRFPERLAGIFWVTAFGPDMVEYIGKHKFERVVPALLRELSDQSIMIQTTEKFGDYLAGRARSRVRSIKWKLGWWRFWSPLFGRRKYPPLRNAIIEP